MNGMKNGRGVFQMLTKQGKVYAILMLLSGCAINTSGDFCDIYQPVYADYERDTTETLRQIEFNNVVFDKDCN